MDDKEIVWLHGEVKSPLWKDDDTAMNAPALYSDIILIGPIRAGKSTIGRLLAELLDVPQISMDALCWDYYREIGFYKPNADVHGPDGMIASRFHLHALERLLADHQVQGWNPNEYFLRHPSNVTLARHILYTEGKSPEQTRDEIVSLAKATPKTESGDKSKLKSGNRSEGMSVINASQKFAPDSYFTQGQYDRMQQLLAHRGSLSAEESDELDTLIDAEPDATVARTDSLVQHIKS